jgi:beta-N-acetylhexosaminidase
MNKPLLAILILVWPCFGMAQVSNELPVKPDTLIHVKPDTLIQAESDTLLHTKSDTLIQQEPKVVLLKNGNGILPLKRLDTLAIEVDPSDSLFTSYLGRYTQINQSSNPNVHISYSTETLYKTSAINVLCLFGNASLDSLDSLPFDVILYATANTNALKDKVSQIIFGGIGASDTLSSDVGPFPMGAGISTPGKLRFAFTTPEALNFDGPLLRCRIDSLALLAIDSGVAPGIQVLIAKDGQVVYHQAYGYQTYEKQVAVRKDMLYDFASITKITGALPALMKLHDQNEFDLDATMGTYLDYFSKGNKKDLQYRQILSHNAQLKAWIPYWTTTIKKNGKYKRNTLAVEPSDDYSIKLTDNLYLHNEYKNKIYKQIKKSSLNEDPGYVYSGLSFYLYPEIVETLTQEDYETYLKQNFYRPLGAYTVTYNPLRYFPKDKIIPTEVDTFFRNTPLHGVVHDEGAAMMDGVSSNAGLFGTTLDLAKIIQMYLWKGEYGGERYISSTTIEKFTACHYCQEGNRRGLAFDKPVLGDKSLGSTAIEASEHSFGHSGYTGTFAWADPDNGILFVFMSNRVYPTRENPKLYQLNIRPAMHQIIYDVLLEK